MRRTAVLSLLLLLLASPAAWGQTTTTTPSTTTTSTTSTTVPTTTTVPGATAAPPGATLASAAGEVAGIQGSYCWSHNGQAVCADTIFFDPTSVLPVRAGETLSLRFLSPKSPTSITVHRFDRPNGPMLQTVTVPPGNPARFGSELPVGVWILIADTRWDQGGSTYFFKVDVKPAPSPPARPKPAAPRFTG